MADADPAQPPADEEQPETAPEPAQEDQPGTPGEAGTGDPLQPDVRYQD